MESLVVPVNPRMNPYNPHSRSYWYSFKDDTDIPKAVTERWIVTHTLIRPP